MDGAPGWPIGVQPISLEDLENLGIDHDGMLYWAGRPMTMSQKIVLTWPQVIVASLTALFAIIGGLAALAMAVATLR